MTQNNPKNYKPHSNYDADAFIDEIYDDEIVRDINDDIYEDNPSDNEIEYFSSDEKISGERAEGEGENVSPSEDLGDEPKALEAPEATAVPEAMKADPVKAEPVLEADLITQSAEAQAPLIPQDDSPLPSPLAAEESPMITLWNKGYSHFIIAKHLSMSTKVVRDQIEELGLSEKQGKLDLPDDHAYWNATLPEKREIERQLLASEQL